MLFGMYQCFMLLSTCNDVTWSVFRPWKKSQINSAACSGSSSFWHSSLTYIISILFKCFKTWAVLMRCFLFVLRLKSPGNKTLRKDWHVFHLYIVWKGNIFPSCAFVNIRIVTHLSPLSAIATFYGPFGAIVNWPRWEHLIRV